MPTGWWRAPGAARPGRRSVVPLADGSQSRRRAVAAIFPTAPCAETRAPRRGAAAALPSPSRRWRRCGSGRCPAHRPPATLGSPLLAGHRARLRRPAAARRLVCPHHTAGRPLRSWRWAVPPLLGTAVAVAVLGGLPLRARFTLSRAAIASARRRCRGRQLLPRPSRRLSRRLVAPDGRSTGVLVDDRCGFFRLDGTGADPGGSAESAAGVVLTHAARCAALGGGWRAGCLPTGPGCRQPLWLRHL